MKRCLLFLILSTWALSAPMAFARTVQAADDQPSGAAETIPAPQTQPAPRYWAGDFPALPPDPNAEQREPLPALEDELWHHGGSYLYHAEGDQFPPHGHSGEHEVLRLPENWQAPQPATLFSEFLGTGPIRLHGKWPGCGGYAWEPRLVGYGSYELFGFALEQNGQRQDALGHQLIAELDLRLTGTERMHVQFRPLGVRNTGGSYYQFSQPQGYIDNSSGVPQRYWVEGELQSVLGSWFDPFVPRDLHVVAGKFPFALHNTLLMNDEILGAVVNKNTLFVGGLSNLNVQLFTALDDLDRPAGRGGEVFGIHVSADQSRNFYELTYALVTPPAAGRSVHYAGVSRTQMIGCCTLAGRALFKWADTTQGGSGQLFVLESSFTRAFAQHPLGISHGVYFCNAFYATPGWSSIAGANLNRLRTAFEVNPLERLAAGLATDDTAGVTLGVQLFRHHEDESLVPELALESRQGQAVWGCGLRYLRKTGPRTQLELLGVINGSDDPRFDREGLFGSHSWIF